MQLRSQTCYLYSANTGFWEVLFFVNPIEKEKRSVWCIYNSKSVVNYIPNKWKLLIWLGIIQNWIMSKCLQQFVNKVCSFFNKIMELSAYPTSSVVTGRVFHRLWTFRPCYLPLSHPPSSGSYGTPPVPMDRWLRSFTSCFQGSRCNGKQVKS